MNPAMDTIMEIPAGPGRAVRVAVEGCGHGTLHAIYSSIKATCAIKGWDNVDLLIIGGDFQAVRNQRDLNVTSMPAKYRKMADFHEYYSGARKASCPTIFIGGNHEASNHLFELYYGGWVAPDIYYLGAANVVHFGPLRIAGLTGIWKGYDFRKPHFERLPYNREEMNSIYHVRELDVRKLLCLRSQVDIGLSHDWPQGVEFHGDHEWLFQSKPYFKNDSFSGKLGSVAAQQCLDRLRPPFWFSAHLHTKFGAVVEHARQEGPSEVETETDTAGVVEGGEPATTNGGSNAAAATGPNTAAPSTATQASYNGPREQDTHQVSAWQQFHVSALREDTEERDKILQEQDARRAQEQETGHREGPQYTFQETFNQVGTNNGGDRTVLSTSETEVSSSRGNGNAAIPNVDGSCCSRPDGGNEEPENRALISSDAGQQGYGTGANPPAAGSSTAAVANPDAIDIDMSDEEPTSADKAKGRATAFPTVPRLIPPPPPQQRITYGSHGVTGGWNPPSVPSEESDEGGAILDGEESTPVPSTTSQEGHTTSSRAANHGEGRPSSQISSIGETQPLSLLFPAASSTATSATTSTANNENEVSEELRAELAALSSNFTAKEKIEVSPPLPFPAEISNTSTKFLALGKCEPFQEFLQLLPISSTTAPDEEINRPLKLRYDPEWLAIQRVFAPELQLGGNSTDKVPKDRGETYYREQINKEMEWIKENVVAPGLLDIPHNFTLTAPVHDPDVVVHPDEQPREATNPQTSAYCALIGIPNKFDIDEAERDARSHAGPRPESADFIAHQNRTRGQGGRGFSSRGGGGGRGFSAPRGGGRGGGGSRGYGRGDW